MMLAPGLPKALEIRAEAFGVIPRFSRIGSGEQAAAQKTNGGQCAIALGNKTISGASWADKVNGKK